MRTVESKGSRRLRVSARSNGFGVPCDGLHASVLTVCDEPSGLKPVLTAMSRQGRRSDTVGTGAAAFHRLLTSRQYGLLLIVPPLPDITAVALCRMLVDQFVLELRPALMVLGRHLEAGEIVEAFDAGADCIIADPDATPRIVAAKVEAVLRRSRFGRDRVEGLGYPALPESA